MRSTGQLLDAAVANNASWCADVCGAHSHPGARGRRLWASPGHGVRFYPDVITLSPEVSAAEVLAVAPPSGATKRPGCHQGSCRWVSLQRRIVIRSAASQVLPAAGISQPCSCSSRTQLAVQADDGKPLVVIRELAGNQAVTVEPGITITAPRTASRDIRRHKASRYNRHPEASEDE